MKFSKDKKSKLYIILTLRHNNMFGKEYCLFWGYDESSEGYTGDPYHAHRYSYEEAIKRSDGKEDIMIPIELLELENEYTNHSKNILCLMEKGTLNRILGLKLRS